MAFVQAGVGEAILVGRTGLKLRETAQRIANNTVNTTSQSNIQKLFDALKTAPDILINNAGFLAAPTNFVDADLDEYWNPLATNVFSLP